MLLTKVMIQYINLLFAFFFLLSLYTPFLSSCIKSSCRHHDEVFFKITTNEKKNVRDVVGEVDITRPDGDGLKSGPRFYRSLVCIYMCVCACVQVSLETKTKLSK